MPDTVLIDEELAAFLHSGVSVHAASRDAANVPCLVRGVGCRVSADRRRVTIFLLASQCGPMLGHFAANGAIAFVASQPSTHRTVQLKATDAQVGAPLPGDDLPGKYLQRTRPQPEFRRSPHRAERRSCLPASSRRPSS